MDHLLSQRQPEMQLMPRLQWTNLTETTQRSQEEYARRLEVLAQQFAEETRRRAEAEAEALAHYRAHTDAQARSQVGLCGNQKGVIIGPIKLTCFLHQTLAF